MTEKRKLEKYCGDISQIYDLRHCILQDGRSKGTHAILADNGLGLELMLLPDKCLGIPKLKYGGLNIGFMCKNGISAPEFYQEEGTRGFLKNFEAGFLTTCGLTYFGSPCEVDGQRYGLHGAIANTPMENVCTNVEWKEDQAYLKISGDAREGYLFGPNLLLHKEITIPVGENIIEMHDTIENKGFEKSPLMILYHFNYGYPFLTENAQIYTNYDKVTARDEKSESRLKDINKFEEPIEGFEEVVAYRTMSEKGKKEAYTFVYNPEQEIGIQMTLDPEQLPILNQWKSPRAGDYVLGMEPGTGHVGGYLNTKRDGLLMYIEPGERKDINIKIEFLSGEKALIRKNTFMED